MTIENTSLQEEVNEILTQGPKPVHFQWEAVIHTPNGDVTPLRVLAIDNDRDYVHNYCDNIVIEVAMGYGTFQQYVIPVANNLTITLSRTALGEGNQSEDLSQDIEAQEWRATLLTQSAAAVEGRNTYSGDATAGDLTAIVPVQFQLVDLAIEQTRMQRFGTVFKGIKPLDAVTYAVTKIAQGLEVDQNHQIKGFEVVPANNTQVYDQMVIPHDTPAVDVPGYIEAHCGAPYSTGLGAYLQRSIWYLYPLYDLSRYDNAEKTVTIINLPKNRLSGIDRTYRTTYNQVVILATIDTSHLDPSEALQLNAGNGTRYNSADQTFDSFAKVANNKAVIYRSQNANEYKVEDRPNGYNNIVTSDKPITSNTFFEMSKVAPRLGSLVHVGWENSNPGLITPGLPCRFLYAVNDQVFELKGVIQKAHSHTEPRQPGLAPGPYRTNTALGLFVEKTLKWDANGAVTS